MTLFRLVKMEEDGEFLKTQKDGELFVHKNFLYSINSQSKKDPNLKFYTCVERKTCKARIHVLNNKYLKTVTEHNHLADVAKVEAKRVMTYCKQQATASQDATSRILQDALSGQSQAVAGALPSVSSMKRTIQRQRTGAQNVPPDPRTCEEFKIPEEFKTVRIFEREEDWLHYDSTEGGKRIVIFTTKKNLELLVSENKHLQLFLLVPRI